MIYSEIRPKTFDKLYGAHIDIIRKDVESSNLSHAMLFTGEFGTGKTSLAYVIAEYLPNCKVVEINAASDSTKKDSEKVVASANSLGIGVEWKIILIEEAQKSSSGFQNALLRPLENPKKGIIFILTTTEPNKIIPTVRSRCKVINFPCLSISDIKKVIQDGRESSLVKTPLSDKVINLIVKKAYGHARDALTELELISSISDEAEMIDLLRVVKAESIPKISNIFYAMYRGENKSGAIKLLNTVSQDGVEGIRRTILKMAFSELNRTTEEEDLDYLYAIIKVFNGKGIWKDFMEMVEAVLEFFQVWKPKLESKYNF